MLRGGPSSEYEVSLMTGAGVLAVLADDPVNVRDVSISRKGEWIVNGFVKSPEQALLGVDVVFIALHGAYGEDGTVQRILERLGLPYTGSGPYASALAMNKALTKEFLRPHGVLLPRHFKISRENVTDLRHIAQNIEHLFGPEYIVKPIAGGSSIDTRLARGTSDLIVALAHVLDRAETVLVEERIVGKEATVGVLEGYRQDPYYVLPAIEIIPPASADFFDATVKYNGQTEEICPGRFSTTERDVLLREARRIHKLMGLRHYSRADFIVNDQGAYFLEVNTLPGLTNESLFPKAIEAVGGTYRELVTHLIKLAHRDT